MGYHDGCEVPSSFSTSDFFPFFCELTLLCFFSKLFEKLVGFLLCDGFDAVWI